MSLTTIVRATVSVPPVFVAETVYDADEVIEVGVPQIVPLLVSNVSLLAAKEKLTR